MSEPLYQLTADLQDALDAVWLDEDGVLHGWADVEAVTADWEQKTEAVALYIKQLKADASAIEDEMDELEKRCRQKEAKAVRLTQYLAQNILAAGRDRFETAKCDCRFRRSKRVIVQDIGKIPEEFIREKLSRDADKKGIKAAIEAGQEVPGAELFEERKLNIK